MSKALEGAVVVLLTGVLDQVAARLARVDLPFCALHPFLKVAGRCRELRSVVVTSLPPASIPATEVRLVHSEVAEQDYLVSVALPFHYLERSDKLWPVIYVLDANLYFGLVVDMVRAMNIRVEFCNELPDAFVVGIGYPVDGSLAQRLHQVMHLRLRDFLRVRDEEAEHFIQENFPVTDPPVSGNAGPFLHFLQNELMPLIESDYRADPADRTVLGHSWGADFALYSVFSDPGLFRRCVLVSPEPDLEDEQLYAAHHDSLPVRMHLVTEDMNDQDVERLGSFVKRLESRHYSGLDLTHQVIANTTHCAVVPPAFQAGLVAVLS